MIKSKREELLEFQQRVYRRYALTVKKNVDSFDGEKGSKTDSKEGSFRTRLVRKLRIKVGSAYRGSDNYRDRKNAFKQMLADPLVKTEFCRRLKTINPEFFEQEIEAEVVRIISEVLPTTARGNGKCDDKEIELFAQITEMIVNEQVGLSCQQEVVEPQQNKSISEEASADEFYEKGIACTDADEWERAIAEFDKAIELNPHKAVYYSVRGASHDTLERLDDAVFDYTRALEIDAALSSAYHNRGMAYMDLELYDLAISDFDTYFELNSIEADSGFADAYLQRGSAYFNLDRFEEAQLDYSKVIAIEPTNKDAYYFRGMARCNLGDFSGAVVDYSKGIELGCDNPDIHEDKRIALSHL